MSAPPPSVSGMGTSSHRSLQVVTPGLFELETAGADDASGPVPPSER